LGRERGSTWTEKRSCGTSRARERIAQVERNLKVQQQIVDVLQGDGCNTLHARKLLQQYQELQARYIADRDRLERDLSETQV
jgi:hypothetical protein